MAGPVETAIRKRVNEGQVLETPGRKAPFKVKRIDDRGLVLLFGALETETRLSWACLEGIREFLRGKGWLLIGGTYDTEPNAGTLDGYLKGRIKRATAGWVAVVLEHAGVIEINRDSRAIKVRLKESQRVGA